MKNVFNVENILKIADALDEAGMSGEDVVITVTVTDKQLMTKANEDFHYRFDPESEMKSGVDVINLKVGGYVFRYVYREPNDTPKEGDTDR